MYPRDYNFLKGIEAAVSTKQHAHTSPILPFLKVQLCEGPGRTQMTKENEAGQYQHTPTYPFMPIVVLQKDVF